MLGRREVITPAQALELLGKLGVHLTPFEPALVDHYAAKISRGTWSTGGPAIRIVKGFLVNGRHRLHAVVKANTPATFVVFRR